MTIIFDGEMLVAHHNPGNTPFLLITFTGWFLGDEAARRYSLDEFVKREGVACVGISARKLSLYITPELDEAAAAIRAVRRPGQKVVVFGQSAGGYAAVKFARLLEADGVVAFSPIFSMDESDLRLTPEMEYERWILQQAIRFNRFPLEKITPGMRPGPEDCPVPLLFAYDPQNENDGYAAARFAELFPEAHFTRSRNIGHAIIDRIEGAASAELLLTLFRRLSEGDVAGAAGSLNRLIRTSEASVVETIIRMARHRPALVPLALATRRAHENLRMETRRSHPLHAVYAYELVRRGDTAGAIGHMRTLLPELFPPDVEQTGVHLVMSCEGEVLGYNHATGEAELKTETLWSRSLALVLLDLREEAPRFVIPLRADDMTVVVDRNSAAADGEGFVVVPVEGSGLVGFRRGGAYLRGRLNDTPIFTAQECLYSEQFALLPVATPEAVRGASNLNWFEQALLSSQSNAAAATERTQARKTKFRTLMQRFFAG